MNTEVRFLLNNIYNQPGSQVCPKLSQGTVAATNADILNPNLIYCTYTIPNLLDLTSEDITKIRSTYISGPTAVEPETSTETLNTTIFPTYCQGVTTMCPIDPATSTELSRCSRLIEVGNSIDCRLWAANPDFTELVDTARIAYCDTYLNAPECGCVNKDINPVYNILGEDINPAQDHCWFVPCANPAFYLQLSTQPIGPCADVCGVVVRNFNSQVEVDLDEASFYVNCEGFTENEGGGGGTEIPGEMIGTIPIYGWVLIVISIIIILVGVIFVVVFGIKTSKKKKSQV
jgi:hypothetical protein